MSLEQTLDLFYDYLDLIYRVTFSKEIKVNIQESDLMTWALAFLPKLPQNSYNRKGRTFSMSALDTKAVIFSIRLSLQTRRNRSVIHAYLIFSKSWREHWSRLCSWAIVIIKKQQVRGSNPWSAPWVWRMEPKSSMFWSYSYLNKRLSKAFVYIRLS